MSAYRRISRGSRSLVRVHHFRSFIADNCILMKILNAFYFVQQQSTITNSASTTETIVNSTSNSTSNLNENPTISSNGSADALVKQGQTAIKYDELQAHTNKFEHELSVNGNGFTSYSIQPKHIRFPDVPYSSELVNELMIFLYTMIATAMQFMHLYRTVWWLPDSNTSQTMVNRFKPKLNILNEFLMR